LNCIRIQGKIFIFGYLKAKGNRAYRIFLSEKHSSLPKDTPILPPPALFVLLLPPVLQVFYPQLLIHFHLPLFFFFHILPIFIIFLPNGIRKNPSLRPPLFLISSYSLYPFHFDISKFPSLPLPGDRSTALKSNKKGCNGSAQIHSPLLKNLRTIHVFGYYLQLLYLKFCLQKPLF
jgi:hypothetical protein